MLIILHINMHMQLSLINGKDEYIDGCVYIYVFIYIHTHMT